MIAFETRAVLLLLPLSLLPFLARARDATALPSLAWLPSDPLGDALDRAWRVVAALTIASLVVGLAGPGLAETRVERVARGAEILILLDRSSSMDATIRRNAPQAGQGPQVTRTKNEVVRAALADLVAARPDNRYALTFFNVAPIRVAPFTDDAAVVAAGLAASGIGRGPSETDMGEALLAAVEAFEGRPYRGSRAIVLVSDGGARLDEELRRRVADALARHRVALYFVYVQSDPNSPDLETVGTDVESALEEVALHVFFAALDTDYRVFQADDPESMARAVAEIDRLQSSPLVVHERVPRVDRSAPFFAAAALGAALLFALGALRARPGP